MKILTVMFLRNINKFMYLQSAFALFSEIIKHFKYFFTVHNNNCPINVISAIIYHSSHYSHMVYRYQNRYIPITIYGS